MSAGQFTPGPWSAGEARHAGAFQLVTAGSRGYVCEVRCGYTASNDLDHETREANARLIAAAPDHVLIGWAMCVQDGTWEEWDDAGRGEFCFAGLRHATQLDEFGIPILTPQLRDILSREFADWCERKVSA